MLSQVANKEVFAKRPNRQKTSVVLDIDVVVDIVVEEVGEDEEDDEDEEDMKMKIMKRKNIMKIHLLFLMEM